MKSKHILIFVVSMIMISANAFIEKGINKQEKETVTIEGVFDGYDADDGYIFLVKGEEDEQDTMYFTEVTPEVLKAFNLKSEDLIGDRFMITYEIEEFEEEDEEGYVDVYEKYTITKLKKL